MSNSTSSYPLTLYFDGSCPLCLSEMTNLRWRDAAEQLRFVDVSVPGFASPLEGVSVADLMTLMHARTADGRVFIGVAAFELAYAAAGLHQIAAAIGWRGWRWALERLYPFIARHRQRVPKAVVNLVFGKALRSAAQQATERRCDATSCAYPVPLTRPEAGLESSTSPMIPSPINTPSRSAP
ncbi:thiol-disulfide oxidoreductase DCC family protein [Ottowia sp.]|uniref:thiol-disulfide oxidoreductase DCC family protein n=1 Tax=Ottowia sp. TaxID=1898956 RepID=UPI003A8A42DD